MFFYVDGNPIKEAEIDVQMVEQGDILKVSPGSRVPADGLVIWGSSHIDESMITGEALPVSKTVGDNVIGGTLNTSGALHIRVTRVGSEAALAQIVDLVETAQMVKAPIQKFADFVSIIQSCKDLSIFNNLIIIRTSWNHQALLFSDFFVD